MSWLSRLAGHRSNLTQLGCAGLYRGFAVTLVRDVPSHGVYFGVYDYMREYLEPGSRRKGNKEASALFCAGEGACTAYAWHVMLHFQPQAQHCATIQIHACTVHAATAMQLWQAAHSRLSFGSMLSRFIVEQASHWQHNSPPDHLLLHVRRLVCVCAASAWLNGVLGCRWRGWRHVVVERVPL